MGIDIETTGLDREKDCITEIAIVIMEQGKTKPLHMETFLVYETLLKEYLFTDKIVELTGINYNMCLQHGIDPHELTSRIKGAMNQYKVECVVAHNGRDFDFPFIATFCQRNGETNFLHGLPTIDTREDLPEELYAGAKTGSLSYLASYSGFLNPFPHAALFDVMTMMRLLFSHDVSEIVKRSKIPWVIVTAKVGYKSRQLAKDRMYRWQELGDLNFPKQWVKKIKENMVEKEQQEAPFDIEIIQ